MLTIQKTNTQSVTLLVGESNRLMIATIGRYAHDRIIFAITNRPVQKMVLIHSDDPLSQEAALKIQSDFGESMVDLINADPWDFNSLLITAMKLPSDYPDFTPEYHIGLGTRVMTMALAIAALFLDFEMYMVIEDEEKTMREIKLVHPLPSGPISAQKKLILEVLCENPDGFGSISQLVRAVKRYTKDSSDFKVRNCEISNFRKHLNTLEQWEFVQTERVGNSRSVKITPVGIAVLSLKKYRKTIWSKP